MKINVTSIKKLFSVLILAVFLMVSFSCCSNGSNAPAANPAPQNTTSSENLDDYPEIPIPDSNIEDFVTNVSSVQMAKNMVIGWNLGNTLDADGDWTDNDGVFHSDLKGVETETGWGMPETTEAMITAVEAAGFKTIRIPVSWHNHITDETNYTIDPVWMARVKEVVDWAYNKDMYVILNIHHDNLSEANLSGNCGFALSKKAALQTQSKAYIRNVWTQIAIEFASYGEKLVFEVLNEPRDVGGKVFRDEWNYSGKDALNIITAYEQVGIDAIRAVPGNKNRFIMVPGYAASGTNATMLGNYTMPTDSSATDKLILSTHAYSPYNFAMANSDSVFGDDDKAALTSIFNYLKTNYTDKGIGVVMGEASASNKDNTAERIKWANYYFAKAKDAGISVVLWDNDVADPDGHEGTNGNEFNGEHHGWLNRKSGTWYFPSIIKAMMDTVGVTGYTIPEYVAPTPSSIGWNESNAVTVSNEQKTIDWNSEYKPAASYFAYAKEGSILKITFTASGATLRLTSEDWTTDYNTGDMLNGNASGTNITVTASEFYYILTASDAADWKAKGLTISGANGTITSIKFLANPSVN